MFEWLRKHSALAEGFIGALLAILFVLFWLRAYQDDQTLRAIVAMINANEAKQAQQVPPPVQKAP